MAIRKGIFKVRNTATGEKDEVMLKTTIEQVDDLDKLTGATANASGVWGLAPAPAKGSQNLPLCGDATYKVLPITGGGTGVSADSADALLKALIGSGSIGSSSQPIYYKDGRLYAGGYTVRLNHNTSDTKIPVISNGFFDYILKSELANATTGGGIVAANLAQNGYVKFSNGLILQWGYWRGNFQTSTTITFPVAFSSNCYTITVTSNYNSTSSSYCDYIDRVLSYDSKSFRAFVNTNAFFWNAIGR